MGSGSKSMGKRELLLIICFVIVGAVVYQATAPPADPNEKGFSLSRFLEMARREVRGNRASAVVTRSSTIPIDREVTEVRIIEFLSEVEILGEDRADVEASLRVHSSAYDDGEAKKYADETVLKQDRTASSLTLAVGYVQGRHTGRQRATLTLKIPNRLRARIETRPGKLSITNVASVEATNSGGETTIKNVEGRVAISHRGGSMTIENVGALKLTGRSSEVKLLGVKGDASIVMEQGGELRGANLGGPLDIECRNADVTLENLEGTRGPIRVNAINGTVTMNGVKSETRVDGRNAELNIAMTGAAPIAIYSDGEEVGLTPPPGGFRLDAVVVDGRMAPDTAFKDLGLEVTTDRDNKESRASGAVRGGGPTITVRTTRGDLTLREPGKTEK